MVTKQAKKWFLILLASGLAIGGVTAFGIVKLINKLGLAPFPNHRPPIEFPKN